MTCPPESTGYSPTQRENGLVVARDYPSTHVTGGVSYSVDAWRMADLANLDGSTEIVRRYGYDRRGWMKSFKDERVTTPTESTCSGASLFDEDGGACMPAQDAPAEFLRGHTYTYDAVGNWMDSGSQIDGNLMTGLDGYTLRYDDDGNLTQKVKDQNDLLLTWNS